MKPHYETEIPLQTEKGGDMRRSLFLIIILMVLSLTFFGCPKKTPPPPPMPIVEPEPEPVPEPEPEPEPIPEPEPLNLRTVYFDFDRYDLRSDTRTTLTDNAKQLIDRPTTSIRLQGHCDDRGTEQYNLALGQKRAESVKQFLINYGISAGKIETISYGEEKPLCAIKSEDCWERNRRVEFIIISE